jgi:hypothetical protein
MRSDLFFGDALLEEVAGGYDHISHSHHATDPAVLKLQRALLWWDRDCLPVSGDDGVYQDETAAAVARFKVEVLRVPADEVIDDVDRMMVITLDAALPRHEPFPLDPPLRDALGLILRRPDSASIAALHAELAHLGITLAPVELAEVMTQLVGA